MLVRRIRSILRLRRAPSKFKLNIPMLGFGLTAMDCRNVLAYSNGNTEHFIEHPLASVIVTVYSPATMPVRSTRTGVVVWTAPSKEYPPLGYRDIECTVANATVIRDDTGYASASGSSTVASAVAAQPLES